MKMHKNHEATCLCCRFLEADYEGDWSDMTPGRGLLYECGKQRAAETPWVGLWDMEELEELHDTVMLAQKCEFFEARD